MLTFNLTLLTVGEKGKEGFKDYSLKKEGQDHQIINKNVISER